MKVKCLFVLVAGAFLASLVAHASEGGSSDGGGNSIICFDSNEVATAVREAKFISDQNLDHIESIEVLDLHEARIQQTPDGDFAELIPEIEGEKPSQFVERIAEKARRLAPRIADMIDHARIKMPLQNVLIDQYPIRQVNDSATVALPSTGRCALVTTAINYPKGNLNFLHIDGRIYFHPKHSSLSRSVLLLHEYLYTVARAKGHHNSNNTRTLVRLLITRNTGMKVVDFLGVAKSAGFLGEDLSFEYGSSVVVSRALVKIRNAMIKRFDDYVHSEHAGEMAEVVKVANQLLDGFFYFQGFGGDPSVGCTNFLDCDMAIARVLDPKTSIFSLKKAKKKAPALGYYLDRPLSAERRRAAEMLRQSFGDWIDSMKAWTTYAGTLVLNQQKLLLKEVLPAEDYGIAEKLMERFLKHNADSLIVKNMDRLNPYRYTEIVPILSPYWGDFDYNEGLWFKYAHPAFYEYYYFNLNRLLTE